MCSCLSRKYNSLIQTQARELSHLRQRMREGQGVCHILTQQLGDTTKVLRPNHIMHKTHHLISFARYISAKLGMKFLNRVSFILIENCSLTPRPLRSCCVPTILITTWVRASESSWRRTSRWLRGWSPRSADVRSCFSSSFQP